LFERRNQFSTRAHQLASATIVNCKIETNLATVKSVSAKDGRNPVRTQAKDKIK
jgi:hypothetical protein